MSAPLVRRAVPADGPAIVALIRALAEFEKLAPPTDDAAARLLRDLEAHAPRIHAVVGELDGVVVAYAFYFYTYSTFLGRPTLFMEDLFVHPDARRRGVARAVLGHLRDVARRESCGRFEWMVLDWNTPAQEFYDREGARKLAQWQLYREELDREGPS